MIKDNLTAVEKKIEGAVKRSGRTIDEVKMIAVSKTFPEDKILEAFSLGVRDFGENRIQEAKGKIERIGRDMRWHLIGHLQTNKAKAAAKLFDVIHSVDSLRLAKLLDEAVEKLGKERLEILLQVNIGMEDQKSGVTDEETISTVEEIMKLKNLNLTGLMTIPPYSVDKEVTRGYYSGLRRLKDRVNEKLGAKLLKELSMGMSNDYDVAIEEGATYVRVGTAIFGERDYR
jgi:pyridoxal phosphate enzyme (YggS family)